MRNFKFQEADIHQIPEGHIHIVESDKHVSMGYLELNPKVEMQKVMRPLAQEIIQLQGISTVLIFHDGEEPQDVVLHPGDYLRIPAQTYYIHSNQSEENISLSMWKYEGDVTEMIQEIRAQYPMM